MMPHQPVNESTTEPMRCLVARDAPYDDLIMYGEG
jgi:uncharacterized RmlC-like cupin family protein